MFVCLQQMSLFVENHVYITSAVVKRIEKKIVYYVQRYHKIDAAVWSAFHTGHTRYSDPHIELSVIALPERNVTLTVSSIWANVLLVDNPNDSRGCRGETEGMAAVWHALNY